MHDGAPSRRKSSGVFTFSAEDLGRYHDKVRKGQIKVVDVVKYHTGISRNDMVKQLHKDSVELSLNISSIQRKEVKMTVMIV